MRERDHSLFYGNSVSGDTIILDNGEKNHAVSVMRITTGQRLQITDGNGAVYDCECADIAKTSMSCKIISKTTYPKITPVLTLLIGLPDREHFETILENATALGVSRIIPLVMDHCRKPWWSSWEKSSDRFTAKMVSAMKQCLYPYMPLLSTPTRLQEIIGFCDMPIVTADQHGGELIMTDLSKHHKLTCLIGPPGGLSVSENELLSAHGSITVRIAPNRLRTELAATVLCSRLIGSFMQK